MASLGGPNIITDGLVGQIDASNIANYQFGVPDSDEGFLSPDHEGRAFQVETDIVTTSQYFQFGADRNTRIQISGTNENFASTTGPFDLPNFDGYTIEVVFMRTDFGTWATGGGTYYDGIWNYYWNHYLAFRGQNYTGNNVYGTGLSNYDIDMDEWYSYTTTHDNNSATNNHKVYINGSLQQTSTVAVAGSQRRFYVGNWDSSWAMVGKFGCIRVYNRALTADEVSQNFNSQKSRFIPN
jgi:hypothetical protein